MPHVIWLYIVISHVILFNLVFTDLDLKVQKMVQAGYSDNTNRVYTSAQKAYLQFCNMYRLSPVAADKLQVLRFIAHLSHRISPTSIKVYLSAVRALHVNLGIKFDTSDQPRAQIMVRGLARGAPPPHQKLPITYSMLSSMITLVGQSYDDIMCWAAITVAFFGCLRADDSGLNIHKESS